jgi:uncharacterized protein with HEPN domain
MLLFAIVRAIEVIGEAASKVTAETQAASPGIPWASIVGMRNRLAHGYFEIDLDVVWKTVTEAVPPLHSSLKHLPGKQEARFHSRDRKLSKAFETQGARKDAAGIPGKARP